MTIGPESGAGSLDARTEQRLLWLMFARLALSLVGFAVVIGLSALGRSLDPMAREGMYWTVAGAFLATVVSGALFSNVRSAGRFAAVQLAIDVLLVTALVHFSGGRESIFAFLYPCIALYGAVLGDRRGALGAATFSALAYGGVLAAEYLGFAVGVRERQPVSMLLALWGVQVGALFLVGALASALAGELNRTGAALDQRTDDLNRLHDLHQRTVESIMSGLLTTDSELKITSFNPEAERISGYEAGEVMGHDVEEVIPGARRVIAGELACEVDRAGSRLRVPFRDRSGRERHLGLAGSPLLDPVGDRSGAVVIFQDVTRVVEMEAELRRSERLAAVGELGAHIAHEIRNPLAAISGSIEMLRAGLGEGEEAEDTEAARLMEIVLRETDRLDTLIGDFLGYARPRAPERSTVVLAPFVEDLVKMVEASRPRNVSIHSDVASDLAVEADPDQLRQVLWNLGVNALHAMPEGGRLEIAARLRAGRAQGSEDPSRNGGLASSDSGRPPPHGEAGSPPAEWVEIAVSDDGAGIAPEVQERMFEPFFTTKPEGTGLGLATVHRIIESHGGTLQVDSRPGHGTSFRIGLPVHGGEA